MKKINLLNIVLALFGAIMITSCSKEEPLMVQSQSEEKTPRCVTSTGDFILCEDLKEFEAQAANGGMRANYAYKWYDCVYMDKNGYMTPGGLCTEYTNGGCKNEFECTPCANC